MNLHAMPQARQQLLAACLAALAGTCLVATLGLPLSSMIQKQKQEIARAEADLAKWEGIIASREAMESVSASLNSDASAHSSIFQASSESQATSGLLSLVRKALQDAGADVKSLQPLQTHTSDGFQEVGVRVTAMASHDQFQDAITRLNAARPSLFVSGAQVQLSSSSRRQAGRPTAPILQIRLDVGAYANVQERQP